MGSHKEENGLEVIADQVRDFFSTDLPDEMAAVYQEASWTFYDHVRKQGLRTTSVSRHLFKDAEIRGLERPVRAVHVIVDEAGLFPKGRIVMTLWKQGDIYLSHVGCQGQVKVYRFKARQLHGRERIYLVGPMQKERDYDIMRLPELLT
ncbi:TPA: hypothetical protein HA265_04555 [Candidatus Woesearchaeota archaeon]|nr:hypothetical protein [Candidatus Woesearchaeota archaeon]